jgi:serine/threonine-protein kinase RIM15
MSGGAIFSLDEDRDRESSPSPSPRASPALLADSSQPALPPSNSPQPPPLPILQIPQGGQPPLLSPQPLPFGQAVPQHRKLAIPYAATPSFPSPLAQAITVPHHSDNFSSSSHSSPNNSDDEVDHPVLRDLPLPSHSASSGTPKRTQEQLTRPRTASPHTGRSASPASTQKSIPRPPSPVRPQILTPGALLMRSKRTSTGSSLGGSLPNPTIPLLQMSPPRSVSPSKKESPSYPGSRRFEAATRVEELGSPGPSGGRRGSGSSSASLGAPLTASSQAGSSPLAFGSPELEPFSDESPRRRSIRASPTIGQKDGNILGLGWVSGWDSSSGSGSSPGGSKDKGRAKDAIGPPSPRRERERTAPGGVSR